MHGKIGSTSIASLGFDSANLVTISQTACGEPNFEDVAQVVNAKIKIITIKTTVWA